MKLLKLNLFYASILWLTVACSKKTVDPIPATNTNTNTNTKVITPVNAPANVLNNGHSNTEVNSWIYDTMKSSYFWTDYMPTKVNTDLTKDPAGTKDDGYFYDLLYKYGTVDRNSWIQNITDLTNSLSGTNTAFGYRSSLYYLDTTKTKVGQFVSYVIKDSPMDKAGLQRGDIILSINGTEITTTNYKTILDFSQIQTATFGLGQVNVSKVYSLSGKNLTVTKATFSENPVAFSKIINKGSKKIGYLLYTQFISTYDNALRNTFANFKSQGVNELVLDLRINPGGYVSSAQTLCSLIGKDINSSKVMYSYELNDNQSKQYSAAELSTNFKTEANNLNLSRLYVLVSGGSASSSELVINSLKPYINVILIGDQTYGKNEISQTYDDKANNYRWKWGMQPLVGRTVNSLGQSAYGITKTNGEWVFQGGIIPDYTIKDTFIPFKPWGDESETLLSKALELITNVISRRAAENRFSLVPFATLRGQHLSDNPLQDRKDFVLDTKFINK